MNLKATDIKYIVVHCSATKKTRDKTALDIDAEHKKRGWSRIGYHYVIRRDGLLEKGRREDEVGAHVYGYNRKSIGVCLIGGLDERAQIMEGFEGTFTPEQAETLKEVLQSLQWKYPKAKILGHRDLSPDTNGDGTISRWEWVKNCPCFDVVSWVKANLAPKRR